MSPFDFRLGFRVLGDCAQPRRLVDADVALAAYAACDPRAECEREAYLSAFRFDADFRAHMDRNGSTRDFAGPCWAAWLWVDVDRADLAAALDAARRLATLATETLGIQEGDVLAFYSGSKGFHIGLPAAAFAPPPSLDFHRVARRFAEGLAERAGVEIDAGVYDRVRCFRAPNSRHPRTGLHKRRLTVRELLGLGPDAIRDLARSPAPFELPTPTYRSEPAAAQWAAAAEHTRRTAEAAERQRAEIATGNTVARLNRATLDFIRDGAGEGDRHRRLYSAAANLADLGAPLPLCEALLTDAALDCGLPRSDTRRAILNGWASMRPGIREVCEAIPAEVIDVRSESDPPLAIGQNGVVP